MSRPIYCRECKNWFMAWHTVCPHCICDIEEPKVPWKVTRKDWCVMRALNIDPEMEPPTE